MEGATRRAGQVRRGTPAWRALFLCVTLLASIGGVARPVFAAGPPAGGTGPSAAPSGAPQASAEPTPDPDQLSLADVPPQVDAVEPGAVHAATKAGTGAIAGTVRADAGGAPLSGICVYAYTLSGGNSVANTTTSGAGTYTLTGLSTGSYKVRFQDCVAPIDYAIEYYNDKPDFSSASTVQVVDAATTSGIDAGLAIAGKIAGTVVAEGIATPLSGICVTAPSVATNSSLVRATTAADGTYLLEGLAAGTYRVRFDDCVAPIDYASEYYDNVLSPNAAAQLVVSSGATTAGVNASLAIGGKIAGTVVADAGGAPLSGICVSPTNIAANASLFRVQTAADGTYLIEGVAAGSYKVRFDDCVSPIEYGSEYYDNTLSFGNATPIAVSAGATTSGINAGLAVAGMIAGTVVADNGGAPLGGICATPFDVVTGSSLTRATTAADGTYLIQGLSPGSYRVKFDDCVAPVDYASEYYDNTLSFNAAAHVTVSSGVTTSGINAGLAIAGKLSGKVVADSGGAPLAGICVSPTNVAANTALFRVQTAADGTYLVEGLAAGNYRIRFDDCVAPVDYATEFYDNTVDFNAATLVSVASGATTSNINAGLAPAGRIAGTIVADNGGTPLAGMCATPFLVGAGSSSIRATTAADGTYLVDGLVPGNYRVKFEDCVAPIDYAAEYYDNTLNFNTATQVAVSGGATTGGINGSLALGGKLAGKVVADRGGAPLSGICVSPINVATNSSIFRLTTAADGTYLAEGLAAGNYKVRFQDCVAPITYATEYYDNKPDSASANQVVVSAGATTSAINASLASSVVSDYDGDGTADVGVFRPDTSTWFLRTASPSATSWGTSGDVAVPGDYDGDGTTDLAVFRPSANVWFLRTASPQAVAWGASGDIPVPADYDGDGKTDIAVFRPSTGVWYVRTPSAQSIAFGASGDIPVPADYDGDGKADLAVFRPSTNVWYLRTASPQSIAWGASGDIPVPADYDGDGKADIGVFRPTTGVWFVRTASPQSIAFGANGDVPVPADYDGDGKADIAVFRPTTNVWYLRTASPQSIAFGASGDVALPLPHAVRSAFF